jgi:hypothetical protein
MTAATTERSLIAFAAAAAKDFMVDPLSADAAHRLTPDTCGDGISDVVILG